MSGCRYHNAQCRHELRYVVWIGAEYTFFFLLLGPYCAYGSTFRLCHRNWITSTKRRNEKNEKLTRKNAVMYLRTTDSLLNFHICKWKHSTKINKIISSSAPSTGWVAGLWRYPDNGRICGLAQFLIRNELRSQSAIIAAGAFAPEVRPDGLLPRNVRDTFSLYVLCMADWPNRSIPIYLFSSATVFVCGSVRQRTVCAQRSNPYVPFRCRKQKQREIKT